MIIAKNKNGFERRISFTPAYDRRGETPNNGQHPMHIAFVLFNESKGALVFDINTQWYIDREQKAYQHAYPWGLVAHRYIDHDPHSDEMQDNCDWLHGEACISESLSGLMGPLLEELYLLLITQGEDALWVRMEQVYKEKM